MVSLHGLEGLGLCTGWGLPQKNYGLRRKRGLQGFRGVFKDINYHMGVSGKGGPKGPLRNADGNLEVLIRII